MRLAILSHIVRFGRSVLVFGIIPLLLAGCYRSCKVIDHLEIESPSRVFPSLRLGSGDGALFCFTTESSGKGWSFSTWQDRDLDCRDLVLFFDLDVNGSDVSIRAGYFGLMLLSTAALAFRWWRKRRSKASAAGGFQLRLPGPTERAPPRADQ
jgi:hypothetical protein